MLTHKKEDNSTYNLEIEKGKGTLYILGKQSVNGVAYPPSSERYDFKQEIPFYYLTKKEITITSGNFSSERDTFIFGIQTSIETISNLNPKLLRITMRLK